MDNYIKLAVQDTEINPNLKKDKDFSSMVNKYIKDSRKLLLAMDNITAASGNAQIQLTTMAPMPSREHLSVDQGALFEVIHGAFTKTAFPWLDVSKMKHVETLMKKLRVLYVSDRARLDLLATKSAWKVRMFL
jgi:hypothetical protein